jgi:hypothetical protein
MWPPFTTWRYLNYQGVYEGFGPPGDDHVLSIGHCGLDGFFCRAGSCLVEVPPTLLGRYAVELPCRGRPFVRSSSELVD